ncbi:MAG: hypothetical protein Q9227_008779 [Pyrenula ochraceoflavens]
MPHSHHSHSGQFCPGHAQNTLEEMILQAIAKKMLVFALTEHMPRHDEDRYPEEVELDMNLSRLFQNEAEYFQTAKHLREKYGAQIELPIGFEGEWIRPSSRDLITRSIQTFEFDFFIGSVHHVHTFPIDFDAVTYQKARKAAGGTDERLFEDFFDSQQDLIERMKPPVIGHFDLIRLMSQSPDVDLRLLHGVWHRILRNLDLAASRRCILEINTSSIRKGLKEPYPQASICQAYWERGGRFCLSDDSHNIHQVGQNYHDLIQFLQKVGISKLCYLKHGEPPHNEVVDERFPTLRVKEIEVTQLQGQALWA